MHRIDGQGAVGSMPTPEAVGPTVGYFADSDAVPPTQVTGDWLNSVQEELVNAALIVDTLDKTDNTQVSRAIVACAVGGPTSVSEVTTEHTAVVVAATDGAAFGANSVVMASVNGRVNATGSVCIAANVHADDIATGVVTGDYSAIIASQSSGDDKFSASGENSAIVACFDGEAGGNNTLIAASTLCSTSSSCPYSAVIGSESSDVAAASGTQPAFAVLLGSYQCNIGSGAASGLAARQYIVTGGYSGAPSWRIESNGGTMRSTAAHTTSGLDYAELFENGDGAAHAPGRLLSRKGKCGHLAQSGDRILGVVSVCPTVVGGDDGLAWSGRYERDEWGAVIWEDVEVERQIEDREAVEAYKDRRAQIQASIREAESLEEKRALAELLAALQKPAKVTVREMTRQMRTSPKWDPTREQVPRSERPDQWTVVGLLGQIRISIGEGVSEGDALMPGVDGVGVTATREYLMEGIVRGGARVEVMEITSPFDAARGYGIALCLVR